MTEAGLSDVWSGSAAMLDSLLEQGRAQSARAARVHRQSGSVLDPVHKSSTANGAAKKGRTAMSDRVYKVIQLVGTSTESWEAAATAAVERASKSLRDLRIAEIAQLDMQLDEGNVVAFRAKVNVSFRYEGDD